MHLSCTHCTPTVHLSCTYCTPTVHLSCTYCTPTVHLSCTHCTPTVQLSCTYCTPIAYQLCTYCTPIVHLLCTYHAPRTESVQFLNVTSYKKNIIFQMFFHTSQINFFFANHFCDTEAMAVSHVILLRMRFFLF